MDTSFKETSHLKVWLEHMIESKLWHNKTETKKVKGTKMVGFNKTCGQYPASKIDFGDASNITQHLRDHLALSSLSKSTCDQQWNKAGSIIWWS